MSSCWCFNIILLSIGVLILGNEFQQGRRFQKKTRDNLKWLNLNDKKIKEIKTCNFIVRYVFISFFYDFFTIITVIF